MSASTSEGRPGLPRSVAVLGWNVLHSEPDCAMIGDDPISMDSASFAAPRPDGAESAQALPPRHTSTTSMKLSNRRWH
jgi:hypothetical protein